MTCNTLQGYCIGIVADELEVRHLTDGLRADASGGAPKLVGYAIRTNVLSEDLGGFRERITPDAVRSALETSGDVVALVNHDPGRVVGRLSAGTLRLAADDQGLRFEVTPPEHERGLVDSVARGDLPGASFEFTRATDTWDLRAAPPTRTITAMRLREISVGVPFPAYVDAHVTALRSLDTARAKETVIMPETVPPVVADPVPPVAPDTHLEHEMRSFSLRALLAGAAGLPGVDWGRERELSQETARRSGRTFEGYAVPMTVFEQRVVTTALPSGGPGSNIISTDYRPGEFIDRLRAALVIRRLGARVLSGLVGNVAIPRLKVSATGAWVAENAALSASDVEVEQVTLSPKHVGALTEYSRNMLMQSSPDIEELLRDDFAKVLARAIDAAAIKGGGSSEPVGILATSGIGDVAMGTNGGAPTWAKIIDLIAEVETVDATGQGFLTNFKVLKKARQTQKVTSTDSVMIMNDRDTLAGYPVVASSLVPSTLTKGTSSGVCSALIFGDFSDVLLGYWSELDVLVNPYESTAYTKGNVQIRAFATCDVKLRQPASFAAMKDLTTT